MKSSLFFYSLAFSSLLAHPALAHIAPTSSFAPFLDDSSDVTSVTGIGIRSGLILFDEPRNAETPSASFVCSAALDLPAFYRKIENRVVWISSSSLFSSTDGGCHKTPVGGALRDHRPTALAQSMLLDDTAPTGSNVVLWVVTATAGKENGLFRSDDGGASFSKASSLQAGLLLYDLVVSPDSQCIVVGGVDTIRKKNVVKISTDFGESFTEITADIDNYFFISPLACLPDAQTTEETANPAQFSVLLGASLVGGGADILLSRDGLQSLSTIGHVENDIRQGIQFQDSLYFVVEPGFLFQSTAFSVADYPISASTDSAEFPAPPLDLQAVIAFTASDSIVAVSDALWSLGQRGDDVLLWATENGIDWQPKLLDTQVRARACPADTLPAQICPPDENPPADGGVDGGIDGGTGDDSGLSDAGILDDAGANDAGDSASDGGALQDDGGASLDAGDDTENPDFLTGCACTQSNTHTGNFLILLLQTLLYGTVFLSCRAWLRRY